MKTSSGATAVQIAWSCQRGSRKIEHIGSAHDEDELEALKAAARQRLAAGQPELDLGLGGTGPSGPLEIASSRMAHLRDALCRAYDALGFPQATGHDEVFRQLVLARIIEPASKQDSLRVLEEAGAPAPSYPTLNRRLPAWAKEIPDGHVFTQPWPAGPSSKRRDQMIYYQFRAERARRTLRGIDEQAAKAAKAVAGLAPVKRNRFIQLDGATKSVNRDLEARARDLAGLKGYITNLAACPDGTPVTADFVISSYHEPWNIEKSFRMSKHDLRARPIYHRKRNSIEAHLTIVFAAGITTATPRPPPKRNQPSRTAASSPWT